jgi:Carboxypeptidase regulatory-like domain
MKNLRNFFVVFTAMLIFVCLTNVQAQYTSNNEALNPKNWDERDEISVPAENVHIIETFPANVQRLKIVPQVADPASVYATTTATFAGSAFAPAGQANTPAITRLMADDLTFIGTAPYSIGRFDFSMCNLNVVAVSARPRVRFYLNNAGTPGTNITGFSFNAITIPASSCSTLFANVTPFSVTSSQVWAGMLFDNSGGTATATQVNSFAMGIYPVPDVGTSADTFYLTTSAPPAGTSYLSNNPGPGATTNLGGTPIANFGWDFRVAGTIASIARANTDPRQTGGTAQWTVNTTGGSITGLTPSNFTLTGTSATGSTITTVTANNISPNSTQWTVTATIGGTAGTLGLNWANVTNLNTNVSNTLPFAGEVYNVNVPTVANAGISGRVTTADNVGIAGAQITLTGSNGLVKNARTSTFGYFNFVELEVGATYILTVSSKRYQFGQPTRIITLAEDVTDFDFTALP